MLLKKTELSLSPVFIKDEAKLIGFGEAKNLRLLNLHDFFLDFAEIFVAEINFEFKGRWSDI